MDSATSSGVSATLWYDRIAESGGRPAHVAIVSREPECPNRLSNGAHPSPRTGRGSHRRRHFDHINFDRRRAIAGHQVPRAGRSERKGSDSGVRSNAEDPNAEVRKQAQAASDRIKSNAESSQDNGNARKTASAWPVGSFGQEVSWPVFNERDRNRLAYGLNVAWVTSSGRLSTGVLSSDRRVMTSLYLYVVLLPMS